MATKHHHSNRELISHCNQSVTRRFGVTLAVYKTIKATTQLIAVATGFYAIASGADPLTTFGLVALIVSGPEAIETVIATADSEPPAENDQT